MAKLRIKAGDEVLVRAGKDKGAKGTVLKVYPESDRILVEGVNRVVRHTKVTPGQEVPGKAGSSTRRHLSTSPT